MIYFLIAGICLIIIEIMTPGIFFFLALGIATMLTAPIYHFTGQISIAFFSIAIFTSIIYFLIKKLDIFKPKEEYHSNIDSYVGKTAIVQEKTDNRKYRVKVFSEIWTAESDEDLIEGDICEIKGRRDNTLIISKK